MEGRKLQLTGGSTYVVSLPKRWVVASGLSAGDTVFLETQADGSVSVSAKPGEKPKPRRKTFEETGEGQREHLLRKFIGAYISGYGLIEIHFKPEAGPLVRRVAREFCRMVIGPEVIEETRNAVIIQDLSDAAELSADKCLRRMCMTVRAMLEDAVQSLRTKDEALARDVVQRDQDVDRLYWLIAKQYHLVHARSPVASDPASPGGIHNHRLVAKLLERIGDHAERIAGACPLLSQKGIDPKFLREIETANASAISILDKAFTAFVAADIETANEAVDSRAAHQRLIDGLSHHVATRKGEELLALATVADSLGRAAGYATDIAETAINHAIFTKPETP